MDLYILGSTLLVFFTLGEVVLPTILAANEKAPLARRIDSVCRFAFPIIFAGLIGIAFLL